MSKAKFDLQSIPKEKFEFANKGERLTDQKFDDKPIGYFKDAWRRFCKNKASIVAAIIILIIGVLHTLEYDVKSTVYKLYKHLCRALILGSKLGKRFDKHIFKLIVLSYGAVVAVPDQRQAGIPLGKGYARLGVLQGDASQLKH